MYHRRRARVLLAALVLTSLVLITVDFRSGGAGGDGPLGRLRGLATTVFAPVQEGVANVVRPVGDALAGVGDLFTTRRDNAALESRLNELEANEQSFQDLQRENDELRGLLEMNQRNDFDGVVARAVALGPSNYEWTMTLDVGADQGIKRDMVVMNGDGLVGRITEVTPRASRVLLAIDPNFLAAAQVARQGEKGPLGGQGGDLMQFRPLDPEVEIEVGDEIVTSSYSNGIFPSGIPIGSVERVGEATSLLSRDVQVRPYVDFTRIDFVTVIKTVPVPEPPPITADPNLPFTPPVLPSPTPTGIPTEPAASPSPSEGQAAAGASGGGGLG